MRILVTGIGEPSGRGVARMLLAAGHEVAGLARDGRGDIDPRVDLTVGDPADPVTCARAVSGCVSALHLAGAGLGQLAIAARDADVRVVVPQVVGLRAPGRSEAEVRAALRGARVDSLLVRTPPVAGRRIGHDTRRALEPILGAQSPDGFQLLHSDDLDRFLTLAATSQRSGVVEVAAPGLVTRAQVREQLRAGGVRYSAWVPGWAGRRPLVDPTAAQREWGFRCGWNCGEVVEDMVRGMIGRTPDGGGFRIRAGAIPLTDSAWTAEPGTVSWPRTILAARHFRHTAAVVGAASQTEVLSPRQIRELTDAQLHVRALLWRDRLHQARQVAARPVAPTPEHRDAAARFADCLEAALQERAYRLTRTGQLADCDDAHYLTLDELFHPERGTAARIARRRCAAVQRPATAPGNRPGRRLRQPTSSGFSAAPDSGEPAP